MRALDRLIAIIEVVAANPEPTTVMEACQRTELSLATTSRLMRDLAEHGLLERDGNAGGFRLGPRMLAIARSARGGATHLLQIGLPVMEELRDETGETIVLNVRVGDRRVCIAQVESREQVRRVVPLGSSLPLHLGATGEVFLAWLSDDEREMVIRDLALPVDETRKLELRLQQHRVRGYAMRANAWAQNVAGLAAPVLDDSGLVAVLTAAGPSDRWTMRAMKEHTSAIRDAAVRISRGLGAQVPDDRRAEAVSGVT